MKTTMPVIRDDSNTTRPDELKFFLNGDFYESMRHRQSERDPLICYKNIDRIKKADFVAAVREARMHFVK